MSFCEPTAFLIALLRRRVKKVPAASVSAAPSADEMADLAELRHELERDSGGERGRPPSSASYTVETIEAELAALDEPPADDPTAMAEIDAVMAANDDADEAAALQREREAVEREERELAAMEAAMAKAEADAIERERVELEREAAALEQAESDACVWRVCGLVQLTICACRLRAEREQLEAEQRELEAELAAAASLPGATKMFVCRAPTRCSRTNVGKGACGARGRTQSDRARNERAGQQRSPRTAVGLGLGRRLGQHVAARASHSARNRKARAGDGAKRAGAGGAL